MRPVTERDIRASFVNCSKGAARRLNLPRGFADTPWDDLDFLGWRDPGAPERAYLIADLTADLTAGLGADPRPGPGAQPGPGGPGGRLVGVALRAAPGAPRGFTARGMCSLCLTVRTGGGVALMTARRTGGAGRQGDSVGRYVCADLACSLYVRGRRRTATGTDLDETLTLDDRIARTLANLDAFLRTITR